MKVKFSIINLVLGGYSLDSKHFSDCIMCVSLLLVPTICVCLYHVCLSVSSVSVYFICVCLYHVCQFTSCVSVCIKSFIFLKPRETVTLCIVSWHKPPSCINRDCHYCARRMLSPASLLMSHSSPGRCSWQTGLCQYLCLHSPLCPVHMCHPLAGEVCTVYCNQIIKVSFTYFPPLGSRLSAYSFDHFN